MNSGFTYIGQIRRDELIDVFSQWMRLVDHLISILERDWKSKGIFAHFDKDSEGVIIFHTVGSAKVRRIANKVFFENHAGVELEKIEADKEEWFFGRDFIGWETDSRTRQLVEDGLELLMESFLPDAHKLLAATAAAIKLEDISNGFGEYDN